MQVAIGKDVGMASHQLAGDAIDHLGKVEMAILAPQLAVVDDLKQQIAQLVAQLRKIPPGDGVGDLVGLFQGVGHDAGVVLAQVPGAAVLGIAQPGHEVQQVVELVHWVNPVTGKRTRRQEAPRGGIVAPLRRRDCAGLR